AVRQMLRAGGIEEAQIVLEAGTQALGSADDFWMIALGSGYRGTIEQLDPDGRERVRQAILGELRAHDVRAIETNVIYALATKQ
ncbi:MAG TPA: hypothetical protein VGN32_01275, partial [Ktedonobacterales bacterium]|nr:hypothetical protein [Ktedonobacterales bacterium]